MGNQETRMITLFKRLLKGLLNIVLASLLLIATIWFISTQPLLFVSDKIAMPDVSPQVLESQVRHLSEVLPAREGFEKNLNPTLEWIEKQIKPYGESYRQSYQANNQTFHNIIIEFGPKPSAENEMIVIGAHYDTAHGFPGADDNASAVAGLIELARLLSEKQLSPKADMLTHPIQLVFYTLEEPPYFRSEKMGSFIHASDLINKQQKIKIMIALDMIGYFSDEKRSQHFPIPLLDLFYPDQGNFIAVVGNLANMKAVREIKHSFKTASELPVYSFNAPSFVQGIDFSDHLNFWNLGYKAVLITNTSFNRNLAYHTEGDTADRLDYVKMAKVVQAIYKTVIDYQKN